MKFGFLNYFFLMCSVVIPVLISFYSKGCQVELLEISLFSLEFAVCAGVAQHVDYLFLHFHFAPKEKHFVDIRNTNCSSGGRGWLYYYYGTCLDTVQRHLSDQLHDGCCRWSLNIFMTAPCQVDSQLSTRLDFT